MKKVFTTGQVAKICKVAPRTVSKWFDSGRLRGYRIPGSQDRRIPREHLGRGEHDHAQDQERDEPERNAVDGVAEQCASQPGGGWGAPQPWRGAPERGPTRPSRRGG